MEKRIPRYTKVSWQTERFETRYGIALDQTPDRRWTDVMPIDNGDSEQLPTDILTTMPDDALEDEPETYINAQPTTAWGMPGTAHL